MPLDDWQFWVVTAVFLAGAYALLRPYLATRRSRGGRRVQLTVDRRRVSGRKPARGRS